MKVDALPGTSGGSQAIDPDWFGFNEEPTEAHRAKIEPEP